METPPTTTARRLPPPTRRRAVTLAALGLTRATGCSWFGSGPKLRDGDNSLVPPGSRVLEQREGDCETVGPSPSCTARSNASTGLASP